MTLAADEFIRRFMLHILPSGLRKIRHYGILAARNKSAKISVCKKLTRTKFKMKAPATTHERLRKMLGEDFDLCPRCGVGRLARASPGVAIA